MAGHVGPQLQASIIPILYERTFLEEHDINITDYAKRFCSVNSKHGKTVTRHDVEWYWEGNIRAEFDTINPSHHRLISQTKCPKFESYWLEKTAVAVSQAKKIEHAQSGLWLLRLNKKESKYFKNALVLGNNSERWIIPDVSLMAIDDVFFNHFTQNVLAANAGDSKAKLDDPKLFRLWGALVRKAYDFVPKEAQIEKLKEAFSVHPPTTEAGLEEFFDTSSKKRKTAPSSKDDAFDEEHSVSNRKGRRVSLGEFHVRRFDNESTLDPSLKPILKYTYEASPRSTIKPSANAMPSSSTKADGDDRGEKSVDLAQKKIEALKKELAELKVVNDEVEHKHQSERGMRRGAEKKIEWLQVDLQKSQDLVARLAQRSTKNS